MKLKDKVAVITDRDGEEATKTAHGLGNAAVAIRADVSKPEEIEALFAEAAEAFGRVDILVNNAGIGAARLVLDIGLEELESIVRINLTGAFLCSQQAARRTISQGTGGKIINIVSLSGQKGGVGRSAYGASKAGLEVLSKIMAVEFADHGINVNAIAPGPIMTETGKGMHTQETVDTYHRLIPQRRYGEPSEIASAAVFLASSDASYITGHTLNVDGGFLAAGLMFPFDPANNKPIGASS